MTALVLLLAANITGETMTALTDRYYRLLARAGPRLDRYPAIQSALTLIRLAFAAFRAGLAQAEIEDSRKHMRSTIFAAADATAGRAAGAIGHMVSGGAGEEGTVKGLESPAGEHTPSPGPLYGIPP